MFRFVVSAPLVPSYSRLTDPSERAAYWERVLELWGVPPEHARREDFFPGSNPRSVSVGALPDLRRGRFHVALKSDGVRYALVLTTRPGVEDPVALMIDRARNMFEVEVVAPEDYFVRGTVLEGELVTHQPEDGRTLFLVFDCVRSKGRSLLDRPFSERLAEAHRCTKHSAELCDATEDLEGKAADADAVVLVHFRPRLVMQPKHFVAREHAVRMWSERNDAHHRVDGLVLQDVDAPYRSGVCDRCLKWKEVITVDLRGRAEALHCAQGLVTEAVRPWRPRVDPASGRIAAKEEADVLEYAITAVDEATKEVTLFALRGRPDKRRPNSAHVVRCSIEECLARVALEDLVA